MTSAGQPEVFLIRGKARLGRTRPADPLGPGRDLGVIHVRVIIALAAGRRSAGAVLGLRLPVLRERSLGMLIHETGNAWPGEVGERRPGFGVCPDLAVAGGCGV